MDMYQGKFFFWSISRNKLIIGVQILNQYVGVNRVSTIDMLENQYAKENQHRRSSPKKPD